jgi:oxygen-dependent protoporphyrinogen oxidase
VKDAPAAGGLGGLGTGGVHVAVVGGGICGLAAAYRLRRLLGPAARLTVFERAATVGGALRAAPLAGHDHDVGAEAFLLRRPEAVALAHELGLGEELVPAGPAGALVRLRGRLAPLPPRTLLGVPSGLDGLDAVLSTAGLATVRAEPSRPMHWDGADVAVGPLVAGRLGPEVLDRLVDPLLGGVYAGRADTLGLRATMPALAAALDAMAAAGDAPSLVAAACRALGGPPPGEEAGHPTRTPHPAAPAAAVVSGKGRSSALFHSQAQRAPVAPLFGALRGGMSVLVDALVLAADARLRLGQPVRGLARTPAGWRLEVGPAPAPDYVEADAVLLAVPPPALRRLLAPLHLPASAAAGGIEVASSAIVSLALPAGTALPAASGVLVASGEPLHAKAFTFTAVKWPHLAGEGAPVVLRASLGRRGEDPALLRAEDAELVRLVRADLAALTGVTAEPVDAVVTRWGGALPQYDVGHLDRVRAIETGVASLPRLAVAGAALHGIGIPACIATADAAAGRLAAQLSGGREPTGAPATAGPVQPTG